MPAALLGLLTPEVGAVLGAIAACRAILWAWKLIRKAYAPNVPRLGVGRSPAYTGGSRALDWGDRLVSL